MKTSGFLLLFFHFDRAVRADLLAESARDARFNVAFHNLVVVDTTVCFVELEAFLRADLLAEAASLAKLCEYDMADVVVFGYDRFEFFYQACLVNVSPRSNALWFKLLRPVSFR